MEILLYVLIAVLVLVAAGFLYLLFLDGGYEVKRTLVVNRDPQSVFDKVMDFTSWNSWSPWFLHEPDAKTSYSAHPDRVGGSYSWDGEVIGAGKLTHQSAEIPREIMQKIEFTRPHSAIAEVFWHFREAEEGATEVTWGMTGKMPFLLRFMASRMPAAIGRDYELGLHMLNGELDAEAEYPRIRFEGIIERPARKCLCQPFAGTLEQMRQEIESAFTQLTSQAGCARTGMPFLVYRKISKDNRYFELDFAVPLSGDPEPGSHVIKNIPGGRFLHTMLYGDYRFLEVGWPCAFNHLRMHKYRYDAKRPSLEVYENDPVTTTHSNEISSSIYLPIKE